jgi:glycosyltransferase involved in cell wall biosynthesis
MSAPSVSLVIAVYNSVRSLELILAALERQTFTDFEAVVADDGSGPEIRDLVDRAATGKSFPIKYVWHEDDGFRKNAILNKAVVAADGEHVVFIDGDCVPHRHFLRDHARLRRQGSVLCGRRVNLSPQMTERITLDSIRSGAFERLSLPLVWDGLLAHSANLEDAIRIENDFLRGLIPRNRPRILGCNFSVEKRLLEEVNGFNEDYRAPGLGEDSDIAFRLGLIGARFVSLRYLATLFHLYHPRTSVGNENKRLYDHVVRERNPVCANGLVKLHNTQGQPA